MRSLLRRPSVWAFGAFVIATAVVLLLRARGPVVRTVLAERRDLEQHIVASGRVRVPTRVQVSAQLSGLVVAVTGLVAVSKAEKSPVRTVVNSSVAR